MKEQTKSQRDLAGLAKGMAWASYIGAVLFSDVMFVVMMWDYFPSATLGIVGIALSAFAIFGSVALSISAIGLPLAMHHWTSPGKQFWAAIMFWVVDVLALVANIVVAVGIKNPNGTFEWIRSAADFTPAMPVLAVIGWGIIFLLDDEQMMRQALREASSEMTLFIAQGLREAVKSPEMQSRYQSKAAAIVDETAASMFGAAASTGNIASPVDQSARRVKELEAEVRRLQASVIANAMPVSKKQGEVGKEHPPSQ